MNPVLALRGIRVQGANAVAGLTWGFPLVSSFLGFVEALDRRLRPHIDAPRLLDGCAIICHAHETLTDSHYGTHQFSLPRHPIQASGKTAPFVEEGRMHLSVTLLVTLSREIDDVHELERRVALVVPTLRLAGGTILDVEAVECHAFSPSPEDSAREQRRLLMRCLPGFSLIDRSDLLPRHLSALRSLDERHTALDAWMDFAGLRYRPSEDAPPVDADGKVPWERVALPETGWFVPLATGYRTISPVEAPGAVSSARDPDVPFAPVEPVYGVGQWLSPHRATAVSELVWRTEHTADGRYAFVNTNHQATTEDDPE